MLDAAGKLRDHLLMMKEKGRIKLSEEMHWEIDALVRNGIGHLGRYHAQMPLKFNKQGDVISEDFKVLYYYHNRLENYELAAVVPWAAVEIRVAEESMNLR